MPGWVFYLLDLYEPKSSRAATSFGSLAKKAKALLKNIIR